MARQSAMCKVRLLWAYIHREHSPEKVQPGELSTILEEPGAKPQESIEGGPLRVGALGWARGRSGGAGRVIQTTRHAVAHATTRHAALPEP